MSEPVEYSLQAQLAWAEQEIRDLRFELTHLKQAYTDLKVAYDQLEEDYDNWRYENA